MGLISLWSRGGGWSQGLEGQHLCPCSSHGPLGTPSHAQSVPAFISPCGAVADVLWVWWAELKRSLQTQAPEIVFFPAPPHHHHHHVSMSLSGNLVQCCKPGSYSCDLVVGRGHHRPVLGRRAGRKTLMLFIGGRGHLFVSYQIAEKLRQALSRFPVM